MEKEIAEYTRRCLDDCGFSEEQKVQYLKYLEKRSAKRTPAAAASTAQTAYGQPA